MSFVYIRIYIIANDEEGLFIFRHAMRALAQLSVDGIRSSVYIHSSASRAVYII